MKRAVILMIVCMFVWTQATPASESPTTDVHSSHAMPPGTSMLPENNSPFTKPVRQKLLLKEVDEAVVTAHHMQVDRESFLALVKERLDYFERKANAKNSDE